MFLYTNNKLSEREIKTITSFTTASNTTSLAINLTKEVKDLYTENYKTMMKETEQGTNKYIFCAHELEELIVKMFILSKAI